MKRTKLANFWTWTVWSPILITLISGTVSSLANKVIYDTPIQGTDSCGKTKFQKAYFFTLCMFIGEALCLLVYFGKQFRRNRLEASAEAYQSLPNGAGRDVSPRLHAVNQLVPAGSFTDQQVLGGAQVEEAPAKKPPIWVYAVLCCFDLSATSVGGVGLIWVDASTNQMLRGSMVVFCAIFSVLMLKRSLSGKQWSAIGVVCIGLALVGLSGLLKKKYSSAGTDDSSSVSGGQMLVGILLVLLASALNAVQNVFEEKLLKAVGGAEVDPLELVGWEGTFGTLLSAFVLLPIVYYIPGDDCGKAEDSLDTLVQLGHSPLAIMMSLSFIFGLMLMNWTSQQISQQLSAVHRNLVSAVRTVLVWVGSLILFYTTKNDENVYGEQWTNWSLMELAGFLVLVAGTVLYSFFGLQIAREQAEREAIESSPDHLASVVAVTPDPYQNAPQNILSKKENMSAEAYGNGIAHSYGRRDNVYDEDE